MKSDDGCITHLDSSGKSGQIASLSEQGITMSEDDIKTIPCKGCRGSGIVVRMRLHDVEPVRLVPDGFGKSKAAQTAEFIAMFHNHCNGKGVTVKKEPKFVESPA